MVVEEGLKLFDLGSFEGYSLIGSHVALGEVVLVLVFLEAFGMSEFGLLAKLSCSLKWCLSKHSHLTTEVAFDLEDRDSSP